MRKELLQRIHQGHMGIEKSKRRARDVLYWPGMNSQINGMISRCTICSVEHQRQSTKEPMIPYRIPSKPWEIVATDLFTWDKSEYLIVVDYHSRYFEVHQKYHSHHLHQIYIYRSPAEGWHRSKNADGFCRFNNVTLLGIYR